MGSRVGPAVMRRRRGGGGICSGDCEPGSGQRQFSIVPCLRGLGYIEAPNSIRELSSREDRALRPNQHLVNGKTERLAIERILYDNHFPGLLYPLVSPD